jgi:hypothetical protein
MTQITVNETVDKMERRNISVALRWPDIVRQLQVDECIEIEEAQRHNKYNRARMAMPIATFKTKKIEGKCFLIRTA